MIPGWKEMVQLASTQDPYQVWKLMFRAMDATSRPWYWKEHVRNATNIGNVIGTEWIDHDIDGTQVPPTCGDASWNDHQASPLGR